MAARASSVPTTNVPSVTTSVSAADDKSNIYRRFSDWIYTLFTNRLTIAIIFITAYDLIEAFAHFGDKAIKPLYLMKELRQNADQIRTMVHVLSMISYFLPLFGAVIADSWLGKYRSLTIFSLVAIAGHVLFTLSTFRPLHRDFPPLPFYIISTIVRIVASMFLGPTLEAFEGDQFVEGQELSRRRYFSASYLLFNTLAILALFIYPALRVKFGGCYRSQYCYPLPFGFSLVLYIIGAVFLFCGRSFYRIVPPNDTVTKNLVICVWVAIRQRFHDGTKREHWLDRADVQFSPEFISDVKSIFGLIVLFLPMPIYYSLYQQMETTWAVQSDLLDGRLGGNIEILPDSMALLNTVLVVILIPFVDYGIYPFLGQFNMLKTPLQRMCTGGFCCCFAFVLCGFLNLRIEKEYPFPPSDGCSDLMMINSLQCDIDVHFQNRIYSISSQEFWKFSEIPVVDNTFTVVTSPSCPTTSEEKFSLKLRSATVYSVVIYLKPNSNITVTTAVQLRERNLQSNTVMRFIYLDQLPHSPDAFLLVKSEYGDEIFHFAGGFSDYLTVVKFTKYSLCWAHTVSEGSNQVQQCYGSKTLASFELYKGAIIDTLLIYDNDAQTGNIKMLFAYPEDHISISNQFAQYFLISLGEVLLAVTAISFNYEEAPVTLKSVVKAMWLLARSMGHLLIVTVVQLKIIVGIKKDSSAMFTFAAAMFVDVIIFCFISYRYKYKKHTQIVES